MKILTIKIAGMDVVMTHTSKEMMRVANLWKRNAKAMLKRQGHVATGELFQSMHPKLSLDKKGNPQVDLTPDVDYWRFVDSGVKGADSSPFPGQSKSPFGYSTKRPPLSVIQGWMKEKNIKPRDKGTGQFAKGTHKGLAFAIQESIFKRGLRPSFFISATQKRIEKKYAVPIALAYTQDLAEALKKEIEDGNND
tara:strand:+ start:33 stop:614 length:582 start_codon:yes stop_codon:yes gene_type:complete